MRIRKIILTILGCIIILIGIGIFLLYSTITSINKVHQPKELLLKGGEKQALLIYEPSKGSLSEKVALKTGYIMNDNGYTVTINYPSEYLSYDLKKYDVILFGSPVYAEQVSTVLKNYMENNPVENKEILLYSVGQNADDKNELNDLKEFISSDNNVTLVKYTRNTEESFWNVIKKL